MKKVIFVTNTAGFSKFNAPFMQWLKEQGWRVDNAAPGIEIGNIDNQYDIPIERSPFSRKNIKAYRLLKEILNNNTYDIIHCHTAVGGLIARLAGIRTRKKNNTKIIYTAHGFHFFKGAPLKYWLLFFPMELILSKLTDVLITINEEDYQLAMKYKMAKYKVYKIDGVGISLDRFMPLNKNERNEKRKNLFQIKETDFVLLYTAQFIVRKNHVLLIKSIPNIIKKIPNLVVIFAGNGDTFEESKRLAKELKIDQYIKFLGGRKDIEILCGISDIHVATSLQEGQGINNIEAMACGCPIVVSNIRGHKDVCKNHINGFLFNLKTPEEMEEAIIKLYEDKILFNTISENNKKEVEKYSVKKAVESMGRIYLESLKY